MKPSRVKHNISKTAIQPQASSAPTTPDNSVGETRTDAEKPIEPIIVANDYDDALCLFRYAVNDAESCVLITTNYIQWCVEAFPGFQDFDGHENFAEGLYGLCRLTLNNLAIELDKCERDNAGCLAFVKGNKSPVASVGADHETWAALLAKHGCRKYSGFRLEHAKTAVGELLEVLPVVGEVRLKKMPSGYFLGMAMHEELESCFDAFWSAEGRLHKTVVALEMAQGGEVRKAA